MPKIPELMISFGGEKIDSVSKWESFRREEIINAFQQNVYGVRDIERPENLKFENKGEKIEYGMRIKEIEASFDSFSMNFKLYLPEKSEKPVPAIVFVMHEAMHNNLYFDEKGNMTSENVVSRLHVKKITERGFAVAVMPTSEIYPDHPVHANFEVGVFSQVKPLKPRTKHSWATISAWSWGVSRVVDYLETDSDIDSTKIAAVGHSRGGKTALWAAATDKRILLTVPNNSGCCGAAVLRGKKGEHAKDINVTDWFCRKFKEYNDCEEMLPVDQHMLVAAIAPRYVYITDSIEDEWTDPDAELLAARLASEAYELYGLNGLVAPEKPVLDEVYQDGHIAFHVKSGDHSITEFDWEKVLDYFEKITKGEI